MYATDANNQYQSVHLSEDAGALVEEAVVVAEVEAAVVDELEAAELPVVFAAVVSPSVTSAVVCAAVVAPAFLLVSPRSHAANKTTQHNTIKINVINLFIQKSTLKY